MKCEYISRKNTKNNMKKKLIPKYVSINLYKPICFK